MNKGPPPKLLFREQEVQKISTWLTNHLENDTGGSFYISGSQGKYNFTRSLGALRAPTSSWRPFGPLDFVLCALRALRLVRRAPLRSGPVKKGHFLKMCQFVEIGYFLYKGYFFENGIFFLSGTVLKMGHFLFSFLCIYS